MIELRVSEPDPIILEAEEQDQASLAVLEAFVSGGDIPAYTGSYNVTPTQSQQTLETNGKKMVRDVKVAPIPSQYIIPEGTLEVTENGQQSVREYENVNVNVPTVTPTGEKTINVSQNGTVTEDVTNYATAKVVTNVPASAVDTGTKNINANGTHNVVGYASANVNVPNTYSQSDEGKVVQSGALVSQSSQTVTENGTYDTTLKNEVVVDVQGGGGQSITLLASGSYTKTDASTTPNLSIPVSFTGTPLYLLCYAPTPVAQNQSLIWGRSLNLPAQFGQTGYNAYAGNPPWMTQSYYKTATGNPTGYVGNIELRNNNTTLHCGQQGGNYPVRDNTYNWYIWGYAT